MDNFLSGREHVGKTPKSKDFPQIAPSTPLNSLQSSMSEAEIHDDTGEGGSKVHYVMQDGRVVNIVVTCACGQVTEIDCRYDGK